MVSGLLGDRSELESLFDELADELAHLGVSADVVMVGGSWMLWHSRRASTRDVDSARRFDADLSGAVSRVGARHDLRSDWLNDAAAPYWPAGARYDECEIVYERAMLLVRTPSPDVIFVMKLYRADPQDREDLVSLWPLCRFATAEDAADAFTSAYPHVPEDEFLVDYIAAVARDATTE
jgi:Nucleotidyltransferase of unknown function (DUF6036)